MRRLFQPDGRPAHVAVSGETCSHSRHSLTPAYTAASGKGKTRPTRGQSGSGKKNTASARRRALAVSPKTVRCSEECSWRLDQIDTQMRGSFAETRPIV